MISTRMKKFYKKTGRKPQFDTKEPVGFDKTKVECYNCHKTCHFARECRTKGNQDSRRRDAWNSGNKDGRRYGKQEDSKALVTIDGEGVDWTSHSEEEEDYALMACNSSGSDTKAYTQGLKKVEAQLVAHQQGQLWYEQKIKFMKINLDDKTDVLAYHKKLLAEAMKEKEDLKAKVEKWHKSSKNLGKLLNTQMSANDKFGLGFVTAGGMHDVPPPMTGNYIPSGPDIEIDYSQFTYGPKQTQPSEPETQTSEFDTCESNISTETPELVSEPVVNKSNVACQPKVWSDVPIIEEYESYSKDEYVSIPTKEQETPSFANQQVKTHRETVKNHFTHSKNPKVDKKELGALQNKGIIDSGCSRHMTGNKAYLAEYQDFNGGTVALEEQEEGIDYDEVFAPVARIEAIRIFLAFASYMGFIVYQMDVKSAFLYGKINEEVYVSQPPGFIDPKYPQKVYKVVKALYGLHQAPRAWYATLSTFLLQHGYKRGTIDKTLFIKKDKHDIILTASTPIETQKPLVKDEEASDVDVHLYRSMIGSLMYLTVSRPDIMFAVCACSRFQVTPKTSHLSAVKRIFRYLKGKPKLGLWFPKVTSFNLEAYSDSDYARANLDRKSTTRVLLLISWQELVSGQCKKADHLSLWLLQLQSKICCSLR
ncbi:putative ribonuclease H-like domain-containing protein [Tanacetum coccineum]